MVYGSVKFFDQLKSEIDDIKIFKMEQESMACGIHLKVAS